MYNVDEYQRGIQKLESLGYSLDKETYYKDFKHDFYFKKLFIYNGIKETNIIITASGGINKFTTYDGNLETDLELFTDKELEAINLLIESNRGDC